MMMVYILRCADGALYVGHTHDLEARLAAHNAGEALFTRKRRPVVVAFAENHRNVQSAVAREKQIKRWTRRKKDALIAGDLVMLKRL